MLDFAVNAVVVVVVVVFEGGVDLDEMGDQYCCCYCCYLRAVVGVVVSVGIAVAVGEQMIGMGQRA